jgi:hypothetical protein
MKINWRKIRLTSAWVLFGFGCIPFAICLISALIIVTCSLCFLAPGMLLAPARSLSLIIEADGWDWGFEDEKLQQDHPAASGH